jgi:hypothetical protein
MKIHTVKKINSLKNKLLPTGCHLLRLLPEPDGSGCEQNFSVCNSVYMVQNGQKYFSNHSNEWACIFK